MDTIVKVPKGIVFGAAIVVLILTIGGGFVVVDKTGAFDEGLSAGSLFLFFWNKFERKSL